MTHNATQLLMDLFPDAYQFPLPNLLGTGLLTRCKTKVCGRMVGCECADAECNERCSKEVTGMKHLKLHDIGDLLI